MATLYIVYFVNIGITLRDLVMEQTFFFTNQCTDFSDGVHFTTVYYNEYGDSFNSWNICLDIENHTFTKVYNNRGSNIMDVTYLQMYIASAHDLNKTAKKLSDVNGSGDINIMDATQIQIIIAR